LLFYFARVLSIPPYRSSSLHIPLPLFPYVPHVVRRLAIPLSSLASFVSTSYSPHRSAAPLPSPPLCLRRRSSSRSLASLAASFPHLPFPSLRRVRLSFSPIASPSTPSPLLLPRLRTLSYPSALSCLSCRPPLFSLLTLPPILLIHLTSFDPSSPDYPLPSAPCVPSAPCAVLGLLHTPSPPSSLRWPCLPLSYILLIHTLL
ncbi:hypothetical protein C8J57DRAFT_1707229, partial [Mycena rebaudengoi]